MSSATKADQDGSAGTTAATGLRIILVTGANGGLGQAIAREFLQPSPHNAVFLGVHVRKEKALALAAEFPQRCHCIDLDVTQPTAWAQAVARIISTYGRLDVLVNNAGKLADGLLATMPGQDWSSVLATNLEAAFHGSQAVLPQMISQRGGRIINVSSLSAILAPAGQANYAAAKAGLIGLTQSLAKEVARLNITVNAVCPGFIDTEALKQMSLADRSTAQARIPMRRFGTPREVAAAIGFLACPEASYITGSVLKIDGGIF